MKKLITLLSLVASVSGFAVELSHATNSQLVAELERRLGTPGSGGEARAVYTCSNSRLYVELFSPSGTNKKDFYIGDLAKCEFHAGVLNQFKGYIGNFTLISVCQNSRLIKLPVNGNGTFGTSTDTYIGDDAKCWEMAKQINSSK